jgi:excisionase family DNA binding protein
MTAAADQENVRRHGLAKVSEVADFLKLSRAKVYQLMDAGELCHVKLGRSRRIRWEDVLRLVEQNRVG